jgi:hypothetical protein
MDLVAAGPVKASLGEPPLGRPKTASPSPPRWVQARSIANQAPIADCNSIELFAVMHRPSIDMRPFARSKTRRAPAPIERRLFFAIPVEASTIGRIDSTHSALGALSAFCLEGHSSYVAALVPPPCRPLLADCHTPM